MNNNSLYLIPNLLGDSSPDRVLPEFNKKIIESLNLFAVENSKEARRFLVRIGLKHKIDSSAFFDLNKKSTEEDITELIAQLKNGKSVGVITDAGCPGIADPGALLVNWAHKNQVRVVPLIGPSSILLALIASGLNGQSFAFHGYLDREKNKRIGELRKLESSSRELGQTKIFMETPYRNTSIIEDTIKSLNPNTQFCIAANISLEKEYIRSMSIKEWRQIQIPNLQKQPAIFLISA